MSIKDILILKNLNLKEYRWGFFISIVSFIITFLLFYILYSFGWDLSCIFCKYSPISFTIFKFLVLIAVFIFLSKKTHRTKEYYFTADDWKKDWIFQGGIHVNVKNDSLVITDSNSGCLYDRHIWKDFRMMFKVKLIGSENGNGKRLGIIFKAKNLGNYYMLQIEETDSKLYVFPMVRMLGRFEKLEKEIFSLKKLNGYHNVALLVKGDSAILKIDDDNFSWFLPTHFEQNIVQPQHGHDNKKNIENELMDNSDFIQKIFFRSDYGKIGFRNHSFEKAEVKDLEIKSI